VEGSIINKTGKFRKLENNATTRPTVFKPPFMAAGN
jgi:hypothetical protein